MFIYRFVNDPCVEALPEETNDDPRNDTNPYLALIMIPQIYSREC